MCLNFQNQIKVRLNRFTNFILHEFCHLIGRMVSKDSRAYTYLPESVNEFPDGERFLTILAEVGFVNNSCFPQTFGIASIYEAFKKEN